MTTVGYGDISSISVYGRLISMINAVWGTFIISLLVASIGKIFQLSEAQEKAIEDIKRRDEKMKEKEEREEMR